MSYTDFKKQADWLTTMNDMISGVNKGVLNLPGMISQAAGKSVGGKLNEVKPQVTQATIGNKITDALNTAANGVKKVTNWAASGIAAPYQTKAIGSVFNAGKQIANTVQAKDPGLVAADAFKDSKSTQRFLNSLPQTIQTGTNLGQQQKALGFNGLMQGVLDSDKLAPERKAALFQAFKENNPEWVPSLVKAVKGGSMEGLKELQNFMGKDGSGAAYFTEEEQKQLTDAAKSASWNAIKSDPFSNIPKVAGLFLRQHGMGGLADFAESPFAFYGSLLAILFGGGMLLSSGNDQQQPIIINQGGGSYDPRMAQIPYSYR